MNTDKKTLKNYFSQCSHPKLFKKVWKQGGANFNEFKKYPTRFSRPEIGDVGGFIYHYDTVKFSKKNIVLIIEAANFEGIDLEPIMKKANEDETDFFNALSWLAWDMLFFNLCNYLEI